MNVVFSETGSIRAMRVIGEMPPPRNKEVKTRQVSMPTIPMSEQFDAEETVTRPSTVMVGGGSTCQHPSWKWADDDGYARRGNGWKQHRNTQFYRP